MASFPWRVFRLVINRRPCTVGGQKDIHKIPRQHTDCKIRGNKLRPTYKDVVDWDVDEFHEVSNEAHDSETDGNRPADVQVFFLCGLGAPC